MPCGCAGRGWIRRYRYARSEENRAGNVRARVHKRRRQGEGPQPSAPDRGSGPWPPAHGGRRGVLRGHPDPDRERRLGLGEGGGHPAEGPCGALRPRVHRERGERGREDRIAHDRRGTVLAGLIIFPVPTPGRLATIALVVALLACQGAMSHGGYFAVLTPILLAVILWKWRDGFRNPEDREAPRFMTRTPAPPVPYPPRGPTLYLFQVLRL